MTTPRFAVLIALAGCTSLGPMPATTGVPAVPHGRPAAELGGAIVPAWRLSAAASGESRNGHAVPQASAVIEPDRLLGAPGLILGARAFGRDGGDVGFEPLVGYRVRVEDGAALAAIGYGTKMSAASNGADYEAIRAGAEVTGDAQLAQLTSWLALHASISAAATYVSATGHYCIDAEGDAIDCSQDGPNTVTAGEVAGLYPTGTAALAFDIARGSGGFHGVRVAFMASGGYMPRLVGGEQRKGDLFTSGGVSLTIGFGEAAAQD
jgi:hypothetical protein